MSFDHLGLEASLLRAVSAMGYTDPTPIQEKAIPLVLEGRDLVGCAQTGTGKTAAFVLPLLQRIPSTPGRIKALVVTPTRELALQIESVARAASRFTRHRVAVVYGGVGYAPQAKALRRGVDVLVATPGRLLDLSSRGDVDLRSVEVLVLDEADRMLDMGFLPDVKRIIKLLPEARQNLLFSATMSPEILKVIESTLDDPARVEVAPANTTVEAIEQSVYPVGGGQKVDLLFDLIERERLERVLVFTRTKHRADRVARVLERRGVMGAAIHGNRSQAQRQKALDGFKSGRYRVLVATDIVARGIDVDGISHVINFDLPNVPEDYVHRIGRTARAGRSGTAISLFAPEEHTHLRDIERVIGLTLECADLDGFEYSEERLVPDPERAAVPVAAPKPQGRSGRRGGSGRAGRASGGASRSSSGRSNGSGSTGASTSAKQQPAAPKPAEPKGDSAGRASRDQRQAPRKSEAPANESGGFRTRRRRGRGSDRA